MTRAFSCQRCGNIEDYNNFPPSGKEKYLFLEHHKLCSSCMLSLKAEENIINKLLLLYLVDYYNKLTSEELTEERLQALVFLAQKEMQEHGMRGFTYNWVWEEDDEDEWEK